MKFDKKYLKWGLNIAILIGLVIAGVKYLNGDDIRKAFQSFDYRYAPFVLGLSALYLALLSWRFGFFFQPLIDKVKWGTIMKAYAAGQAATLLPGGVAARAGLLKQADVEISKSAVPVVYSSLFTQLVLLSAALIAAIWVETVRVPALILLGVLLVVSALIIIPATRSYFVRFSDWLAGKFGAKEDWHDFLDNVQDSLDPASLGMATLLTVVGVAVKIIALDLVIRGLGFSLPYSSLILAYVLPTILGRLSGMPGGGLGVTEAGMVGYLTSTSDMGNGTAFAAAAMFRVATDFFIALLGGLVYATLWRGDKEVAEGARS